MDSSSLAIIVYRLSRTHRDFSLPFRSEIRSTCPHAASWPTNPWEAPRTAGRGGREKERQMTIGKKPAKTHIWITEPRRCALFFHSQHMVRHATKSASKLLINTELCKLRNNVHCVEHIARHSVIFLFFLAARRCIKVE